MKVKFNVQSCFALAAATLSLVSMILAIVSNATPMYPLQGFAVIIIASLAAIAVFVLDFLNVIKIKPLRDGLLVAAVALLAVCIGYVIVSRGYAFGTTVYTKVESHNPYLVKSFTTGLTAVILYGITIVVAVARNFFRDKKSAAR